MSFTSTDFAAYRARGWALCRIPGGSKNPTAPGWQLGSVTDPTAFASGGAVGLVMGPPSGGLICVDLDFNSNDGDAWEAAEELLPPTALMDGRPGKPTAHRFYRITDEEFADSVLPGPSSSVRKAMDTGRMPRFPGTRRFSNGNNRGIDFLGAGAQAVVPPSRHAVSGTVREWYGHDPGEPARLSYTELRGSVFALADRLGLIRAKKETDDAPEPPSREVLEGVPLSERTAKAVAYLKGEKVRRHGAGQGYHAQQYRVGCVLCELGLPIDLAWPMYQDWNAGSATPDDDAANNATLENAYKNAVFGARLAQSAAAPPLSFDLCRFVDTPEREISWIWKYVIPRGMLSLIAGKQGLGKTFVLCDIISKVSTGSAMPDGTVNLPGSVLFLAREDDAGCVLRPRLEAAGADLSQVSWSTFSNTVDESPLDLAAHINLLIESAKASGVDLIVIDTFAAFATSGTDANAAGEVRVLLDALARLARQTGAAVLVSAHLRKTGAGDGDAMDAIAGSAQMTAGVRVASMLDKGRKEGERWFHTVKNNLGPSDPRGWTWRFVSTEPGTLTISAVPRIEWAPAGDEYGALEADRRAGRASVDLAEVRAVVEAVVSKGAMTLKKAALKTWDILRRKHPDLRKLDVEAALDDIAADPGDGLEAGTGPRSARLIGRPGTIPEHAEVLAARLARPGMTVSELAGLAGCRRAIAAAILRDMRQTPVPSSRVVVPTSLSDGNRGTADNPETVPSVRSPLKGDAPGNSEPRKKGNAVPGSISDASQEGAA